MEIERHKPDIILLDEVLPGESSLDLLRTFHKRNLPVILVTGITVDPGMVVPEGAVFRLEKPTWDSFEGDKARFEKAVAKVVD